MEVGMAGDERVYVVEPFESSQDVRGLLRTTHRCRTSSAVSFGRKDGSSSYRRLAPPSAHTRIDAAE
jgi:hypothetical protein